MLAELPYRHELESDVEPFRSILLGLFFLSVGMLIDFNAVAARPGLVFGLALGIIVVKAILIAGLAFLFGMEAGRAIWLGLLLSQAGEFGFVLFGQAASAQLITPRGGVAVRRGRDADHGLDAVPDAGDRMDPAPACRSRAVDLDGPEFSPETNAIVVGYGRFGQTVAQMLMAKRIPRDHHRQQAAADRDSARSSGPRSITATAPGSICCGPPAPRPPRASCSAMTRKELTREKLEAVFDSFPQAAIMARLTTGCRSSSSTASTSRFASASFTKAPWSWAARR